MTVPATGPRRRPFGVFVVAALVTAAGFAMWSPPDVVQGDLTRMLYVHVPAIIAAYSGFAVTTFATITYLVTGNLRWDRLAAASAEVGVVFLTATIATGMIWGKPVWGVWWTWDARLTTTALMLFIYLGYLGLRRAVPDPQARAKRSAILGVLAVVQIPIVHFSVTWWNALHQAPTILRPGDPQIDPPLLVALLVSIAAFVVAFVWLVARRVDLARLEDRIETAERDDTVAGEAVVAPSLGVQRGPEER